MTSTAPQSAARANKLPRAHQAFWGPLGPPRRRESPRAAQKRAEALASAGPIDANDTAALQPTTIARKSGSQKGDQQWRFAPCHALGVEKSHSLCLGVENAANVHLGHPLLQSPVEPSPGEE